MDSGSSNDIVLQLFETPRLSRQQTEFAFPARGFHLVALLFLSPSGRMTRQAAAAMLWEDASDGKASDNLRQVLVRVKRAWPSDLPPLIEASGTMLMPGPGAALSDLAQFLRDTNSDDVSVLMRGLMLFGGDLLDESSALDGEFGRWLHGERARLKHRFFLAASSALIELTRFGRAQPADLATLARRMLSLEPEREESYRALMEAYGRNGMFAEAEALYEDLRRMLRRELDVDPAPETASVARRVFAAARERVRVAAPVHVEAGALPRVALFPPAQFDDGAAGWLPLMRALIEDVANNLSRFRTFTVIAAHSSFRSAAEAGETADPASLRADYAVSSFLMPGSAALSIRLLRDDEIVWAAEYPGDPAKLQTTFRMLSNQIATSLADSIERDRLARSERDADAGAYRHYLEGQLLLKNCDLPMLRRARASFRGAAERSREFGPARARIAQTLQLEWLMLGGTDPYLLQQAKAEAGAAIELDPGGGAGHWMAAVIALYQRDYDLSIRKFAEAESLNPNSADLLVQHADALAHFGENDAGWERFLRAVDINPLAPDHYWWAGASIAFNCGDYAKAIELCGRMENKDPVLRLLSASHALAGDLETARSYGVLLKQLYPGIRAQELVKLSPDRNEEANQLFLEGLRLAGIG